MGDELVHDVARHVDGDGQADTDIAAGWSNYRGVDSHDFAVEVDEYAARIPGIDRGVGLDEVLISLDAEAGAAERAHNAAGDRLPEPERIADGDRIVSDLEGVGISERHARQMVGRDLAKRDIG